MTGNGGTCEYGWAGRILWVDLSRKTVTREAMPRDWQRMYVGGRGVNVRILFDEVKAGTDPLSEDNVIILGTGPLVGTLVGSRCQATGLSPLTGFLGDSNAGGHWGAALKQAGYDHIVVRGRSKTPVYLWIDDETVEVRDAGDLWGRNIWEVTETIRQREGDRSVQVLAIGQAGENLVRYAAVINSFARASGRTGMGTVMGFKRLKCVAVRGTRGIRIARPQEFLDLIGRIYAHSVNHPMYQWYPKYGTPVLTEVKVEMETMPAQNWSKITLPGLDKVTGHTFVEQWATKNRACFGCFFHCDHYFDAGDVRGPGLEYESINAFGPRVGNTDFPTIFRATNLANQYGLDVVSTGGSIALAMDLWEHGALKKSDTDGLDLRWGNQEAILQCVHKIAHREGFGDLLAEGPYLMAQRLGGIAPSRVMHFKKMCPTAVEFRPLKGWALSYATSTVGATHLRGLIKAEGGLQASKEETIRLFGTEDVMNPALYDTVGKPRGVLFYQRLATICDCLEICKFNTFWAGYPTHLPELAALLSAATGMDTGAQDLETVGDRVFLLEKAINTREGYTYRDDMPCERMQNDPIADGKYKGEVIEPERFREMLRAYYTLTGCDADTGIPTHPTLARLGLGDVAEELATLGKIARA